MSKAKTFLNEFYDINHDYNFVRKVGSHDIGVLKVEFDGTGIVDIELPLKDIDPDSDTLIIPIYFTYEDDTVSIKKDFDKYYAASDGKLKDLDTDGKNKVIDYIKSNGPKLENDLEDFIHNVYKEKSYDY